MKPRLTKNRADWTNGQMLALLAGSAAAKRAAVEVNILSVLSPAERRALRECEARISQGWETFLDVGRALQQIRDSHLYRHTYRTFEEYCRERWQFGRSQAYRLIGAAQIVASLSPIGDKPIPTHESQVRPLVGLDEKTARTAWLRAVESAKGGAVTARMVRNAVLETQTGSSHPGGKDRAQPARIAREVLDLLESMEWALEKGHPSEALIALLRESRELLLRLGHPRDR